MQIVTDSGMDLSPEQMANLDVHIVPLVINLEGKSYRSGVDIESRDFYRLLAETGAFPTTSQPSAGEFVEVYRHLAATDPDILSIHISSGLSGTVNAAHAGAEQVPEANVTIVDTKTLSAAQGWQVEAADRALKAGWSKEQILALMERISAATDSIYTLDELQYLIHGGRISHMKGLIASVLKIRPVIGVEKEDGTYAQLAQGRTFKRAVKGLVDIVARQHAPGSAMQVQVLHANNPEGAATLQEQVDKLFDCTWLPVGPIATVLGAHTGPTMVGLAYASLDAFTDMP